MKKFLALLLVFVGAIVLVGCGKGGGTNSGGKIKEILVVAPETAALNEEFTLEAVNKANRDQKVEVTWKILGPGANYVEFDAKTGKVVCKKAGTVVFQAILKSNPAVNVQHRIRIQAGAIQTTKPDLGGYAIQIAQAGHALYETDPFLPEYPDGPEKTLKQKAWLRVQKEYNCSIQVVAYPEDAPWGDARWEYILDRAKSGKIDYDFYTVPDETISMFAEGGALIDLSGFYELWGKGTDGKEFMSTTYKTSGSYQKKLYSMNTGNPGIYNVMYYNVNLLKELGMEKEPAEIFNEGNWTYSAFREYAKQVQAALDTKYTDKSGIAVAGNSVYYWVGMTNAGRAQLANAYTLQLGLRHQVAKEAAETLKAMAQNDASLSPAKQVDGGVTKWNEGKAGFCSGDLWFVKTGNRWPANMWGEDTTKFGYVPWPRPDSMATKEEMGIGYSSTATWVMPARRDHSGYTKDVNYENIYRAMADTFHYARIEADKDPTITPAALIANVAKRKTDTEASQLAFEWVSLNAEGFFEVMANPNNPIANTGFSHFAGDMHEYITQAGSGFSDYSSVIDKYEDPFAKALAKAYS